MVVGCEGVESAPLEQLLERPVHGNVQGAPAVLGLEELAVLEAEYRVAVSAAGLAPVPLSCFDDDEVVFDWDS